VVDADFVKEILQFCTDDLELQQYGRNSSQLSVEMECDPRRCPVLDGLFFDVLLSLILRSLDMVNILNNSSVDGSSGDEWDSTKFDGVLRIVWRRRILELLRCVIK